MKTAVILPACDEATIIGETVRRVLSLFSPNQVFVIADHCQDGTAGVARKAGARVYERHDGLPGKGAAVAWLLKAAAEDLAGTEAAIVLDADSRFDVSLRLLVEALVRDADAAQAFVYPLAESSTSVTTQLAAYSEWLSQALDDRLRQRLGWSVPLRGTGMAFRLRVLNELAPLLRTRVEDLELTLLLASRRYYIAFVPEAIVVDPKPRVPEFLARQRARWLQGYREVWKIHGRLILRSLVRGGPDTWWLFSSMLLRPRTFVIVVKLGAFGILWVLSAHPVAHLLGIFLGLSLLVNALYYLLGLAIIPRSWRRPTARALLAAPAYLFVWTLALLLSIRSRLPWLRARD